MWVNAIALANPPGEDPHDLKPGEPTNLIKVFDQDRGQPAILDLQVWCRRFSPELAQARLQATSLIRADLLRFRALWVLPFRPEAHRHSREARLLSKTPQPISVPSAFRLKKARR